MCKHDDGCNAPEGECSGACMTQQTSSETLDSITDRYMGNSPLFGRHEVRGVVEDVLSDPAILDHIPAVKALREENERLKIAAKYAEHIDATPENQLQTMLYDTCIERDALKSQLAELRQGGEKSK